MSSSPIMATSDMTLDDLVTKSVHHDTEFNAVADPHTPSAAGTKKKRVYKPRTPKTPKTEKDSDNEKEANEENSKKRQPKAKSGATPKKSAFPQSLAEFSESDRLIISMKAAGKQWKEIEREWEKLEGKPPGKDCLRKRHPNLVAVAQEWKIGDARKLATAKKAVDLETADAIKKLEAGKWAKIAGMMVVDGADTYKPASIEKKWNDMVKAGDVDTTGNYVGAEAAPVAPATPASNENNASEGEVEADSENGDAAAN